MSEKVHATIPKGIVGGFEGTVLRHKLGSLSNDDGDVNENGKKSIGFDWQNVKK